MMHTSAGRTFPGQLIQFIGALALCASVVNAPAVAQGKPALKELLERAQSDAERKAAEELIERLQGRSVPPSAPRMPAPAEKASPPEHASEANSGANAAKEVPGTTAAPETTSASQTASQPPRPPEVAPPEAAPPQVAPPEVAVKSADRGQLPSVDLEVFFEFNSSKITEPATAVLTTLARALRDERLEASTFLIAGHTDAKGRAAYNLRLSQMRADAVRRYLIANFGIAENRLVARGFGSQRLKNPQQPLADENRRVQIVNLSAQQPR